MCKKGQKLKIKNPNFAPKNFLSDLILRLLKLLVFKSLTWKSAQTDHFKEMWVLISKGLKHLNTVVVTDQAIRRYGDEGWGSRKTRHFCGKPSNHKYYTKHCETQLNDLVSLWQQFYTHTLNIWHKDYYIFIYSSTSIHKIYTVSPSTTLGR